MGYSSETLAAELCSFRGDLRVVISQSKTTQEKFDGLIDRFDGVLNQLTRLVEAVETNTARVDDNIETARGVRDATFDAVAAQQERNNQRADDRAVREEYTAALRELTQEMRLARRDGGGGGA
jgi:chromosome segregation ATPase